MRQGSGQKDHRCVVSRSVCVLHSVGEPFIQLAGDAQFVGGYVWSS